MRSPRPVLTNPRAKKKEMTMSQMTSLVKAEKAAVKGSVCVATAAVSPRKAQAPTGSGPQHEPRDGGEEDGEELPCLRAHIGGPRREEPHREADRDGDDERHELRAGSGWGRIRVGIRITGLGGEGREEAAAARGEGNVMLRGGEGEGGAREEGAGQGGLGLVGGRRCGGAGTGRGGQWTTVRRRLSIASAAAASGGVVQE
ncbi:hypothetical protein PR202_ga15561 [Eleusine coracana subsp. coracana]|uniref:Uncharacterized protein n=1 Tax=Eleusine coracana subsp. coracana TaxID=191504 RepID=A0AAV5CJR7_ELECO|nr:hypothetical protein PR202_ga15561 [Eleusine coracana subsp. coracana]